MTSGDASSRGQTSVSAETSAIETSAIETSATQSSAGVTSAGTPTGHTITLLSRPGCHLCDEARGVIAAVAAELGVAWSERDITQSADDMREYGEMIPVTLIDGVQHDFWRVDERRLRQALSS